MKICSQTALFVFFFLNPAAEIMFNTLFNIILKTKPGNTERRRRRKENKKGTFTTTFAAGLASSFLLLAFRADVLRGSSSVPGTREEPLRTSAWEATPEVIAKVDSVQSPLQSGEYCNYTNTYPDSSQPSKWLVLTST